MLAGAGGVQATTPATIHLSGGEHVALTAAHNVSVTAGKSLFASVAEKISLFVQNAGMKLFAAKGKIEIQAHSDTIELTAQKTVKVLSMTDNIEVASAKEILLTAGGAYIRIKNGNIEIHAPGKIDIKGAQHGFNGPAAQGYVLPGLPSSTRRRATTNNSGCSTTMRPLRCVTLVMRLRANRVKHGPDTATAKGPTQHVYTDEPETLSLTIYKEVDENDEPEET